MKIIKIDKNDWTKGLDQSRKSYRLVGPVIRPGHDLPGFFDLADGEYPDLAAADTVLSAKSVVYPQSEVMFTYTTDKNSPDCNRLQRPAADNSPRAVIGIRPYDAAAILMLKKNFDTDDYRDPYWCDAYEACTFVGLAVNSPSSTDFSTSVGSGPFSEKGLDVLMVDMGDHYLAKVLTDKGGAFLKAAGWKSAANAKQAARQIEEKRKAAEALIVSSVSVGTNVIWPLVAV